jgi:hypothetical protein
MASRRARAACAVGGQQRRRRDPVSDHAPAPPDDAGPVLRRGQGGRLRQRQQVERRGDRARATGQAHGAPGCADLAQLVRARVTRLLRIAQRSRRSKRPKARRARVWPRPRVAYTATLAARLSAAAASALLDHSRWLPMRDCCATRSVTPRASGGPRSSSAGSPRNVGSSRNSHRCRRCCRGRTCGQAAGHDIAHWSSCSAPRGGVGRVRTAAVATPISNARLQFPPIAGDVSPAPCAPGLTEARNLDAILSLNIAPPYATDGRVRLSSCPAHLKPLRYAPRHPRVVRHVQAATAVPTPGLTGRRREVVVDPRQ